MFKGWLVVLDMVSYFIITRNVVKLILCLLIMQLPKTKEVYNLLGVWLVMKCLGTKVCRIHVRYTVCIYIFL